MNRTQDRTGTVCPGCGQAESIRYAVLPAAKLVWKSGCAIDHLGDVRDYECENCECVWLMIGCD